MFGPEICGMETQHVVSVLKHSDNRQVLENATQPPEQIFFEVVSFFLKFQRAFTTSRGSAMKVVI